MAYTICVWQADMILKFGEVVPFLNKKKRDRLNGWKPILEAVLRKGGKNTRRVDKIVSLGTMRTIGLEIANTHTYITNGVITHNTSRWLIPSKLPYGSHELQVNIYAYILKQSGMEINRLQIQYVDMSGPTKHRSCGVAVVNINGELRCPKCGEFVKNAHLGAVLIDIPFYPEEVIKEYIETRVKSLQASLDANFEPEREPGFLCDYCPAFEICKPGENQ